MMAMVSAGTVRCHLGVQRFCQVTTSSISILGFLQAADPSQQRQRHKPTTRIYGNNIYIHHYALLFLQCLDTLVGRQEGIRPVKSRGVGMLVVTI